MQLVAAIVREAEQRVERAFADAVERELAARRNGDALDVDEQTSTKACSLCGETKALVDFAPDRKARDGRRSICKRCKTRRDREHRAARREREPADEEPHPARRSAMLLRGRILGPTEAADADARRELLAELRANVVEHELRDGREFVVLRLPSFERDDDEHEQRPSIRPRHERAYAIA